MLASHPGGACATREIAYISLTASSLSVASFTALSSPPPHALPTGLSTCPVHPRCLTHARRPDFFNPPRSRFANKIARAKAIKAEFVKKAEHQAKEGRKVADILAEGAIVGVGLIQRDKAGEEAK